MRVSGQAGDNPWSRPVNLSLSGSASEPQIITDNEGSMHIVWQDSIDDFVYVHEDEEGNPWSEPQPVELPFGTRRFYPDLDEDEPTPLFKPNLAVDEDGRLQALWIDEVGDLYQSSVNFENFADFGSWTGRKKLATSVLAVSLDVGPEGRLHAAYIQTAVGENLQPGIFYTQSDNGETWSESVSLFSSLYYRLMEIEMANVQLAVANENTLYVAWDDWPNERVLTIRSLDNGETWDEPNEVDKREEDDEVTAVGPSAIQIVANNEIVHVIWQAGHGGLACNPYYQWSTDGGESWQTAQRIWGNPASCPTDIYFEEYGDSYILKASTTIGSVIVPWLDSKWGQPQIQTALDTMKDPETFKPITYTCGQNSASQGERLWLAACGEDESSKDIWVLSRSLTGVDVEQEVSLWNLSTSIEKTTKSIFAPIIIADDAKRFHVFWGRANTDSSPALDRQPVDLQYSRWEAGQWSTPKKILQPATGGDGNISVVVDRSGRLLAVWSGAEKGEIYFSQVAAGLALLSSEWSEPRLLSIPEIASSLPEIAIDDNGVIYVLYAVPVNEERGIYLIKSSDNGNTWTEPGLVFDLSSDSWGLIDQPRLALAGDGKLHVLWLNQPFIGTDGASLFYAHSDDGGGSWSQATAVTSDNQPDAAILWSQIVADEDTVHRVWQEWAVGQINLWHQVSLDNGRSWSQPIRITGLNISTLPAALMMDRTGQVHLVYFDPGSPEVPDEALTIRHWVWRGDQWHREEGLALDEQPILNVDFVAAALGPDDRLAALYSGPTQSEAGGLYALNYSDRNFPLPDAEITTQPFPTAAAAAAVTADPSPIETSEPLLTPIPTLSPSDATVWPVTGQGQLDGILIGVAAAAVPLGLLFMAFVIKQNRLKNR